METCYKCGKPAEELCPDLYCRDCHESLTFEDCCDGTWNARQALRVHSIEAVRRMYPRARI